MTFLENPNSDAKWQKSVHICLALIAFFLFCWQVTYLQRLKLLPGYLLPLASFCVCFVNCVLIRGSAITMESAAGRIASACDAAVIPVFIVCLNELMYRLHEVRKLRYLWVAFDEGELSLSVSSAPTLLWGVRAIAVIVFVFELLVEFSVSVDSKSDEYAGRGGYVTLSRHSSDRALWFSLVPAMALSLVSLITAITLLRYGRSMTISLQGARRWRFLLPCALVYSCSQLFSTKLYAVMADIGELVLLIGTSYAFYLVQSDLSLMGHYADFLKRSNEAFAVSKELQAQEDAEQDEEAPDSGKIEMTELNFPPRPPEGVEG